MNVLNLVTDNYDRQARLYPALLLIAPVVVSGLALFSAALSGFEAIGGVLLGVGGAFLLSELARDAGKKRERALFASWSGIPSVAIFRHRDTRIAPLTKTRYHKKLSTLVKEAKAPTVEQEVADHVAADAVYAAWSNYLRIHTRDTKKYGLLFKENVSYGYRRNLWGLRPIGIAISLACGIACGVRLYVVHVSTNNFDGPLTAAFGVSVVFLVLWVYRFTRHWVRVPADAYAERLAEATETLGTNINATGPKRT